MTVSLGDALRGSATGSRALMKKREVFIFFYAVGQIDV
jgi:hypothetical protein